MSTQTDRHWSDSVTHLAFIHSFYSFTHFRFHAIPQTFWWPLSLHFFLTFSPNFIYRNYFRFSYSFCLFIFICCCSHAIAIYIYIHLHLYYYHFKIYVDRGMHTYTYIIVLPHKNYGKRIFRVKLFRYVAMCVCEREIHGKFSDRTHTPAHTYIHQQNSRDPVRKNFKLQCIWCIFWKALLPHILLYVCTMHKHMAFNMKTSSSIK